jgi:hypothetical protein
MHPLFRVIVLADSSLCRVFSLKREHFQGKYHFPHGYLVVSFSTNNWGDIRMEGEAEAADTPDAFLKALAESLKGQEGVDAGMADILEVHILKAAPAQNAVAQAKDAILKLAAERANPPKSEVDNG